MNISEILKGSNYSLAQFSDNMIMRLESNIIEKEVKGKITPYINCIVRKKEIKLTPEEIVRQLYLMTLTEDFHYPISRMELEYIVTFGREKKRADIVIITKCPKDLRPMDYRVLTNEMGLLAYQSLFFTTLAYENLQPVFGGEERKLESIAENEQVLLLTGIASPQQIASDLQLYCKNIQQLTFGDHHQFNEKDIERINETFASMPSPKLIITTEKDACRLESVTGLSDEVRNSVYQLPIHIEFMLDQEESFTNKILSYVQKNSRNSILVKGKDDNKPKDSHHSGDRPRTISFRDN